MVANAPFISIEEIWEETASLFDTRPIQGGGDRFLSLPDEDAVEQNLSASIKQKLDLYSVFHLPTHCLLPTTYSPGPSPRGLLTSTQTSPATATAQANLSSRRYSGGVGFGSCWRRVDGAG